MAIGTVGTVCGAIVAVVVLQRRMRQYVEQCWNHRLDEGHAQHLVEWHHDSLDNRLTYDRQRQKKERNNINTVWEGGTVWELVVGKG